MPTPILHGVNLSPFVRKVRFALALKGVEYESKPVMPFAKSEEFLKISPLGKIPVWEEAEFTIPDSSVIIDYLERKHPEPALYPSDARNRARALFLEEYADTRLAEVLTTPFFQRFVRPRLMKQEADDALIERVMSKKAPGTFDYIEAALGDSTYLLGDTITVADIAVASPFVNFFIGGERLDAARWPHLADYIVRLHALPVWKTIVDEDLASAAG